MVYVRRKISELLIQNYFTIIILFSIFLAEIVPWLGSKDGPLKTDITAKYFALPTIFYMSGLTIKRKDLLSSAKQFKLHFLVQTFGFVFVPLFLQAVLFLIDGLFSLNKWIRKGLIIVGCMPPSVSSVVILVKSMNGNESAAILNSILGRMIGVFVTPLLLLVQIEISSLLPVVKPILDLIQTIMFPMFLGQISQKFLPFWIQSHKMPLILSQLSFFFITFTSFCNVFVEEDYNLDAQTVLLTIGLVVSIQLFLMLFTFKICYFISQKIKIFSASDVITITFCSTQKSLTYGLPLLKILYSGYSHLSQISFSLLIYYPVQLILSGFFAPYGKKWVEKNEKNEKNAETNQLFEEPFKDLEHLKADSTN